LAQVVLAPVVLAVEQQVQVALQPVTVVAVQVVLQPVMAVVAQVALRPVTVAAAVQVALRPVTAVAAQVVLRPVTVAVAALVVLQPVTVVVAQVALRPVTVAVVLPQERQLLVANRGRNFSLLLKSAVSAESAEPVPWGQQAAQGPVRWVCEAELPEPLDQGLVEPAGPDCSSVDPVHRVE